jgi:hypothetical protein
MGGLLSPKVRGRVKGGKFIPADPSTFKEAFFCHENKEVELTVKRHRQARSLNQNAYYWGVVVRMIGQQIGEDDPEAVHEMLKMEHNYYVATVGKKEMRIPLSTADLDTTAFEAYLEKIRRWSSEWLSLYIPSPGEVDH